MTVRRGTQERNPGAHHMLLFSAPPKIWGTSTSSSSFRSSPAHRRISSVILIPLSMRRPRRACPADTAIACPREGISSFRRPAISPHHRKVRIGACRTMPENQASLPTAILEPHARLSTIPAGAFTLPAGPSMIPERLSESPAGLSMVPTGPSVIPTGPSTIPNRPSALQAGVGRADGLVGRADKLVGMADKSVGKTDKLVGEAYGLVGIADWLVGKSYRPVERANLRVGMDTKLVGNLNGHKQGRNWRPGRKSPGLFDMGGSPCPSLSRGSRSG